MSFQISFRSEGTHVGVSGVCKPLRFAGTVDHIGKDFGQVDLDKVRDEVAMSSVAIADAHHPEVRDTGEVVGDDIGILIGLLLPRNEPLSSFDGVDFDGAHLTLQQMLRYRV